MKLLLSSLVLSWSLLSEAYDSEICHKASELKNRGLPQTADGVTLKSLWCWDADKTMNMRFELPINDVHKYTMNQIIHMDQALKARMIPLLCEQQNLMWAFADHIALNYYDHKNQPVLMIYIQKSDCFNQK